MTPRPTSHSERSRSRSLISRRASSSSTAKEAPSESSPPPNLPNGADADAEKKDTSAVAEENPQGKSPLLTAHRISVTSDMDDVALDEGMFTLYTRRKALEVWEVTCLRYGLRAILLGGECVKMRVSAASRL
jgi:hypothetical protein